MTPAESGNEPLVRAESLTRRYGGITAIADVDFEIRRGEMFGLIGPDGAGKTTTLRLALGLLRPTRGLVRTFGLDPFRRGRAVSRRLGYLPQRFSLYGDLSVDENVAFLARIHGVRNWRARREELIRNLRLEPFRNRLADRLSGGMRQKLALACTLIHTPELLVLDEPTTGVDPVSRREFWRILSDLQREGMTILLTTPYLDEAERCRRVGLLDQGRLLTVDAPEALRRSARGSIIEILASPRRKAADTLRAMPGVVDVEIFGERLHAALPGVPPSGALDAASRLALGLRDAGLRVESIRPTEASLEDVFIARIRELRPSEGASREEPK